MLGTFNVVLTDISSDRRKCLQKYIELYDLSFETVGTDDFSTFTRGTQRMDYALGTDRFLYSLLPGEYSKCAQDVHTNHRHLHLTFDMNKLLNIPS